MAVAEITNIVIEKGTDFEVTFNLFDPDQSASVLSGLTTTYASIRKYPDTTDGEEFSKVITAGTGTIKLSLTSTQTARLKAGRNYFDVVVTLGGKKTKVIKGTAIVEESASV
jgi:MarR-like DNA-binding transcriptional regulator SgrR of sgrS sRNA